MKVNISLEDIASYIIRNGWYDDNAYHIFTSHADDGKIVIDESDGNAACQDRALYCTMSGDYGVTLEDFGSVEFSARLPEGWSADDEDMSNPEFISICSSLLHDIRDHYDED